MQIGEPIESRRVSPGVERPQQGDVVGVSGERIGEQSGEPRGALDDGVVGNDPSRSFRERPVRADDHADDESRGRVRSGTATEAGLNPCRVTMDGVDLEPLAGAARA